MSSRCPEPAQLAALEDGEATENEAVVLRAHLEKCASCAAEHDALCAVRTELRGPVVGVDVERFAQGVERAVRAASSRRKVSRFWMMIAAAVVGIGGVGVIVSSLRERETMEFAARGGGAASGARHDVALSLFEEHDDRLVRLETGAQVRADARFAMSWATRAASRPHHTVVLAIDATHEVHWMYPAFVSSSDVPKPIELPPKRDETPMATVVRLEGPALGPLLVIALLDPAGPDVVQRIEASKLEERTTDGLRALVQAADVRTWQLTLVTEKEAR
jgi:anti-sigma factor RsiW